MNATSLAVKYRPKTFDEMVEQTVVRDLIKSICDQPVLPFRNFLFVGPAGVGKAQPLYSKVLTPDGFISMKDVSVGVEVFTGSGNLGHVTGVYPQGVRPIYEIELQDRTKIRVSDEHLNVVYRYNEDKKQREDYCVTTEELINMLETSRFKLQVDIPQVDWLCNRLPVDPYLLGALIRNGSFSNGDFKFSNSEKCIVEKVDSMLRRDWNYMLRKDPGDNIDWNIEKLNLQQI